MGNLSELFDSSSVGENSMTKEQFITAAKQIIGEKKFTIDDIVIAYSVGRCDVIDNISRSVDDLKGSFETTNDYNENIKWE